MAQATEWKLDSIKFKDAKIRTGILKTTAPFKSNILYLQGLGDSMLNHAPLFNHLVSQGHNIISFDYMGQGGSTGKMNNTTIQNISELALKVWFKYVKTSEKLNLIGWSTGGLTAYRFAYKYPKAVNKVALIAPGIVPKLLVGKTSLKEKKLLAITIDSLTQKEFKDNDPHIEAVRPNSPLLAPAFTGNLLYTATKSQSWKISKNVKGLVLLSSDDDTYVNSNKTIKILKKKAKHFDYIKYEQNSLHELDNEIDSIARDVRLKISNFFN